MKVVRQIVDSPISWIIAVLLILVIGTGLYLKGYDLGLPLYESKDERRNINEVFVLRGMSDAELWKPGYPPGILYVNYLAEYITEATSGLPATVERCLAILNVRRFGIVFNLLNALLIALIARRLSGIFAGLLAMLIWLFSLDVITQTQFGFPQIYELFAYLLALYLAILAVDLPDKDAQPAPRHAVYAILSVGAGLIAVIFKYSSFPILGLGVGASLLHVRHNRAFWIKILGIQMAMIALCAVWLFFGYDALRLVQTEHKETNLALSGTGLSHLIDGEVWAKRYRTLSIQAGLTPILYALAFIIGSAFYLLQARRIFRLVYGVTFGLVCIHVVSLVVFLTDDNEGLRQNLTITGYSVVLITVGLLALVQFIYHRFSRPIGIIAGLVLATLWLKPNIEKTVDYVYWRDLPVSQSALVQWAGETVPPTDGLVVNDIRPFTEDWSCYIGPKPSRLLQTTVDYTQDVLDLRNDNYAFVQMDEAHRQKIENKDIGQDIFNQMTLIAHIPPLEDSGNWRTWRRGFPDHILHIYTTVPMVETTNIAFGGIIELQGYTVQTENLHGGDTLILRLYWNDLAYIDADYDLSYFITTAEDDDHLLEGSAPPLGNILRPTSTWNRSGELLYVGRLDIAVPADFESGDYMLNIGLKNAETGAVLPTDNNDDYVAIPLQISLAEPATAQD